MTYIVNATADADLKDLEEKMVMGAHYLNALEKEAKTNKPLSEMERQDFIDRIKNLSELVKSLKDVIDGLKKQLEVSNRQHEEDMAIIRKLQKSLEEYQTSMRDLKRELTKYIDRMDRSNDETFNTKSRKSLKKKVPNKSREQEKDDLDGNASDNPQTYNADAAEESSDTVDNGTSWSDEEMPVAGHHTGSYEEGYNQMHGDFDEVEVLECSEDAVPEGWKVVQTKTYDEYDRISKVKWTRFITYVIEDGERQQEGNICTKEGRRQAQTRGERCTRHSWDSRIYRRFG